LSALGRFSTRVLHLVCSTKRMCAKFDEEIVDLRVLGLSGTGGRKPSNAIERELTRARMFR
jgi:hypothetical protein